MEGVGGGLLLGELAPAGTEDGDGLLALGHHATGLVEAIEQGGDPLEIGAGDLDGSVGGVRIRVRTRGQVEVEIEEVGGQRVTGPGRRRGRRRQRAGRVVEHDPGGHDGHGPTCGLAHRAPAGHIDRRAG